MRDHRTANRHGGISDVTWFLGRSSEPDRHREVGALANCPAKAWPGSCRYERIAPIREIGRRATRDEWRRRRCDAAKLGGFSSLRVLERALREQLGQSSHEASQRDSSLTRR
jgi:hypothetical protein